MPRHLHVEERRGGVGVRQDVARRLVDRHGPRTGGRVGGLARRAPPGCPGEGSWDRNGPSNQVFGISFLSRLNLVTEGTSLLWCGLPRKPPDPMKRLVALFAAARPRHRRRRSGQARPSRQGVEELARPSPISTRTATRTCSPPPRWCSTRTRARRCSRRTPTQVASHRLDHQADDGDGGPRREAAARRGHPDLRPRTSTCSRARSSRLPVGAHFRRDDLHPHRPRGLATTAPPPRWAAPIPGGILAFVDRDERQGEAARPRSPRTSSTRAGLAPGNVSSPADLGRLVAEASKYDLIREYSTTAGPRRDAARFRAQGRAT